MSIRDLHYVAATMADRQVRPGSVSNLARAKRAAKLAVAYAKENGLIHDSADTPLVDIMADIMHLCRLNAIDVEAVLRTARMHHEAETG